MADSFGERTGSSLLVAQFADLAAAMVSMRRGEPLQPDAVVAFAARAIPASDHSSLTLIRGKERPQTTAATGALPYEIDALQYDTRQGPCLEAIAQSDIARVEDLAVDQRWPRFAPLAAHAGIRSMFAVRLFLDADQRGALNFYAHRPSAFTDLDMAVGAIFASYASVALVSTTNQIKAEQLQAALESNRRIGIATGILMASREWTAEEAFDHLRRASQHLHRRVSDIAEDVRRTGVLPSFTAPRQMPEVPRANASATFVVEFYINGADAPARFELGDQDRAAAEMYVGSLRLALEEARQEARPRYWVTAPWDPTQVLVVEPHRIHRITLAVN